MVPLEEVHKLLDQAISAWSNRQYEEISHGTTNGPPGRMLRIFLPIIDVLMNEVKTILFCFFLNC